MSRHAYALTEGSKEVSVQRFHASRVWEANQMVMMVPSQTMGYKLHVSSDA